MSRINWVRLIIGGVIAALIVFVTDGVFHENVVNADWKAVHDNLGIPEGKHSGLGVLYFAVFELGRGFVSIFLYAMMLPHFRPGPKTAALAGIVAWIAFSHRARSVHSAGILLELTMDQGGRVPVGHVDSGGRCGCGSL